jgi:aspartate kinase (EC 2.7.2.4)
MVGTPGTAAKIFATLAKAGINVMMISQNPSESSITIVVKNTDLDKAVSVLEMDLLGKLLKIRSYYWGVYHCINWFWNERNNWCCIKSFCCN